MGFGHRVYKKGDSRVPTMEAAFKKLAAEHKDQGAKHRHRPEGGIVTEQDAPWQEETGGVDRSVTSRTNRSGSFHGVIPLRDRGTPNMRGPRPISRRLK